MIESWHGCRGILFPVSFPPMKKLGLLFALLALSCTISPVVTEPSLDGGRGNHYDACKRASKDYCREVLATAQDEMNKCVANFTYECLTSSAP